MKETDELKNPLIVWYGLQAVFDSIVEYAAATSAWDNLQEKSHSITLNQNQFLNISIESLKIQLITQLSKFFDKPETCGKTNCCLKSLKKELESDKKFSSNAKAQSYIKKIEHLCNRYETIVSVDIRNKILAHNDLETLFSTDENIIDFRKVYELVENTGSLVANVCSIMIGATKEKNDFNKIVKKYEGSLYKLQNGVSI